MSPGAFRNTDTRFVSYYIYVLKHPKLAAALQLFLYLYQSILHPLPRSVGLGNPQCCTARKLQAIVQPSMWNTWAIVTKIDGFLANMD